MVLTTFVTKRPLHKIILVIIGYKHDKDRLKIKQMGTLSIDLITFIGTTILHLIDI